MRENHTAIGIVAAPETANPPGRASRIVFDALALEENPYAHPQAPAHPLGPADFADWRGRHRAIEADWIFGDTCSAGPAIHEARLAKLVGRCLCAGQARSQVRAARPGSGVVP